MAVALVAVAVLGACSPSTTSGSNGPARDTGPGGGGDAGMDAMALPPPPLDGGFPTDSGGFPDRRPPAPNPDAFFAEDPPPAYCGPDGGAPDVVVPGGTPECPDDKNREGCACSPVGSTAPCWPGLRANRDRGICRDGTTTCLPFDEFTGAWGPCEGAILPVPGVTRGAQACNCFSRGRWEIDNTSPCFVTYSPGGTYAVSTDPTSGRCPMIPDTPPPPAPAIWSANRLVVDCAGQFRLCYTVKAGNPMAPSPTDCVVGQACTEGYYPTPYTEQELPALPGWASPDGTCATTFLAVGGYGEMTVEGLSIECEAIDDGMMEPFVFNRVPYCPVHCADMPDTEECRMCRMGGSGDF